MLNTCLLWCNMLPNTGIVQVTLLITTMEQETVHNTGDAQCAVDAHNIYLFTHNYSYLTRLA